MKRALTFFITAFPLLLASGCSDGNSPPGDTTRPTVLSTTPTASAIGVETTAVLTVTFSEPMDPATLDGTTFTVTDGAGAAVAGAVSSSGATATFTPASPLTHLFRYTATLTTGAEDPAGNALAAPHAWSFTVVTTPSPLLARETLKSWVDGGLVNGTGSNRVVVLDVGSSSASYDAGHVPGAHLLLAGDISESRKEGPATDVTMVPSGQRMDSVVQEYGIDGNTTVVFTGHILFATRAYFTLRYWGFPKQALKVLDGLNTGWSTAYGLTTDASPAITPSTYSVRASGTLRDDLRASLSEMISVARGDLSGFILDGRPPAGSYAGTPGSTTGVFAPSGDYVVFEGHMNGAVALDYASMYDPSTSEFKSAGELESLLSNVGIDGTRTTFAHCRTGVIASVPFFVLDAILDWPVANYDGSWSQWGQLSGDAANGGQLATDSAWRTDVPELSGLVVYNHASVPVELLSLDGAVCSGTLGTDGVSTWAGGCAPDAPDENATGNEVEEEDAAYMAQ